MSTVIITVTLTAKGNSISNGVDFTFAAGPGMPVGVVSADGKIDLSKDFPSGTPVTLVFTMTTTSVRFPSGPSVWPGGSEAERPERRFGVRIRHERHGTEQQHAVLHRQQR